jgi:NAD(P)-dependent dehydrogenase (short-subunit alcohol dehydrogenase family)
VITGSSGGIGAATVHAFQEAGWRTLGIDREAGSGGSEGFLKLDLASEHASEALHDVFAAAGPFDAVVNNAAVQVAKPLIETTTGDWQHVLGVNVVGAASLISAAVPHMPDGGAIVNVGSVHSVATSPGLAAYVTSKGAIAAMTRAVALELAERGIRVNCVLPGAVDTAMLRHGLTRAGDDAPSIERGMTALASKTPLRRIGRPEDIAQAILFLADGARSSFITGQTLTVDGGATARLSTE